MFTCVGADPEGRTDLGVGRGESVKNTMGVGTSVNKENGC